MTTETVKIKLANSNILMGKGVKTVVVKGEYVFEVTQKALAQIIRKGIRFEVVK